VGKHPVAGQNLPEKISLAVQREEQERGTEIKPLTSDVSPLAAASKSRRSLQRGEVNKIQQRKSIRLSTAAGIGEFRTR